MLARQSEHENPQENTGTPASTLKSVN